MSISNLVRRPLQALPVTASCADAALLMRDQRVGAVAVSEGETLLGMVTDRDLVVRVLATGRDARAVTVGEVMSRNPVYLPVDASVESALETMRELGVRRIPTIDRAGQLDGMLSLDDLLASFGRQFGAIAALIERSTDKDQNEASHA